MLEQFNARVHLWGIASVLLMAPFGPNQDRMKISALFTMDISASTLSNFSQLLYQMVLQQICLAPLRVVDMMLVCWMSLAYLQIYKDTATPLVESNSASMVTRRIHLDRNSCVHSEKEIMGGH